MGFTSRLHKGVRPVRVLFTIAGLHPEAGGPTRSVAALCGALARAGAEVEIVSLDYGDCCLPPEPVANGVRVTVVDCSSRWARRAQWTPQFSTVLERRCRAFGAQIIHDTGLWLLTNHAAAKVSRRLRLPRIVSARGMLSVWALRYKGWKKRLAWWLYQRRDLMDAEVLHATSAAEAAEVRAARYRRPIAMIPNGVEIPMEAPKPGAVHTNHRKLLFLSRIHPKKGLLDLVEAWASLRPSGWRVIIAGGDEKGHRAEVEAAIRERGVERDFDWLGPVTPHARWALYRQADLVVLPSRSENFGLVVAEALACGVPVITTTGTPWAELVTHRCGWWVEPSPRALAEALRDAMSRTDVERREMGARGRELVQARYTWPAAAGQMLAVYQWLLAAGPRPPCVEVRPAGRG